jgi:hypothetical protein
LDEILATILIGVAIGVAVDIVTPVVPWVFRGFCKVVHQIDLILNGRNKKNQNMFARVYIREDLYRRATTDEIHIEFAHIFNTP